MKPIILTEEKGFLSFISCIAPPVCLKFGITDVQTIKFSIFTWENKRRKDCNFLTVRHKIMLLCVPQSRVIFRT